MNEDSPLLAIQIERLNPPKPKRFGLKKYQIQISWRPSSFWKNFFPAWLTRHGIPKSAKLSLVAWRTLAAQATAEDEEYSRRFHEMHDELIRSGRTGDVPHFHRGGE